MLRAFILVLVAYALTANLAFAQAVQVTPISSTHYSSTTFNTVRNTTFEARSAVNGGMYYQRAVTFNNAQIAAATRSRIAGAVVATAAMAAAIAAVGYTLDEITGDIYTAPGKPGIAAKSGVTYWAQNNSWYSSSTISGTLAAWRNNNPGKGLIRPAQNTAHVVYSNGRPVQYNYQYQNEPGAYFYDGNLSVVVYGTADPLPSGFVAGDELATSPTSGTDQQISDAVRSSPEALNDVFHNPTGTPRVVEPMPQVMNEIQARYRLDTNQPLPQGTTDPVNTVDSPTANPAVTAIPAFCQWAKYLCDFVDWVKKPGDPVTPVLLPIETPEIDTVLYDSGLGNGTCPAPNTIALTMGSYELNYEPICDFASSARILVLISASLVGIMLLTRGIF